MTLLTQVNLKRDKIYDLVSGRNCESHMKTSLQNIFPTKLEHMQFI